MDLKVFFKAFVRTTYTCQDYMPIMHLEIKLTSDTVDTI